MLSSVEFFELVGMLIVSNDCAVIFGLAPIFVFDIWGLDYIVLEML